MPDVARRWTREEVLALPDDRNRYELVDGELLVSPSPTPRHQRALLALYNRIHPYVAEHRLGWTCLAPADLDFHSGQLLQPDLFVVPPREGPELRDWSEVGIPLLVVEVLSPSTALADRNKKRRRYQVSAVDEYWIVDCDARLIERWTPEDHRPEIMTEELQWKPSADLPPLLLHLPDYFREVGLA